MTDRPHRKQQIRSAFDRAAASYDAAALVQRCISDELARLATRHPCHRQVERALDAGCGTGYGLQWLSDSMPQALRIALDFAPAMLARVESQADPDPDRVALCADIESLPLAGASLDVAWSSLALQWCDPAAAFIELARVLRPGAHAWIATLGPRTLWELREGFSAVDDADHVIHFHASEHWIDAARMSGFRVLESDRRTIPALAGTLRGLLRDIKAIGAHSVGPQRRRAPLGRAAWRRLEADYERHRREDGLLPATYDVILLALEKSGDPA